MERYLSFLHRCRQYDLLGREAGALLEGLEEGGGGRGSGARPDPSTLRQNKILKFKR